MREYPEDYEPIPVPRPDWYREDIRRSLFDEEGQPEDWHDIEPEPVTWDEILGPTPYVKPVLSGPYYASQELRIDVLVEDKIRRHFERNQP
jgi:hypothetical protein